MSNKSKILEQRIRRYEEDLFRQRVPYKERKRMVEEHLEHLKNQDPRELLLYLKYGEMKPIGAIIKAYSRYAP